MYISRVRTIPDALGRGRLLQLASSDVYSHHRMLWKLFPEAGDRPFLFRQEFESDAGIEHPIVGRQMFYVLSSEEPVPQPGLMDCETKLFEPKLREGQQLAFRLRANPVVARKTAGGDRSKRHDVLMDAKRTAKMDGVDAPDQIQAQMDAAAKTWLADPVRAERAGYRLLVDPELNAYRQHAFRRRGREVRFSSVDYTGLLEVTNAERFHCSLRNGIGRSRAFGCGMWMIRPV